MEVTPAWLASPQGTRGAEAFGGGRAGEADLTRAFPSTSLAWEDLVSSLCRIPRASPPSPAPRSRPTPASWGSAAGVAHVELPRVSSSLSTWAPSSGNGKHGQRPARTGEDEHRLSLLLAFLPVVPMVFWYVYAMQSSRNNICKRMPVKADGP